jgi:adenylosuccinate lyase
MDELPFMITESIIMQLVAKGESRQEAHEQIRVLSHEAGSNVKNEGKENDLVKRIKATKFFEPIWSELASMTNPALYTGRSSDIVEKFCAEGGVLAKKIEKYREVIDKTATAELSV